jgi:hypothetical protein
MCLDLILNLFKKLNSQYAVVIPFPEEKFDKTQTASTDIEAIRTAWLTNYQVPAEQWTYWRSAVGIAFSSQLNNPAWKWVDDKGINQLRFNAGWANAGTMAYEASHVAWANLTDEQKTGFKAAFDTIVKTDPRFILLFKQHPHELVADTDTTGDVRIGGHAENYRTMGNQMPIELRQFYPRLF